VSVFHGLKQGNDVLKEIHKEMNAESVERLLEETAEAREYQRVRLPKENDTRSYLSPGRR
jgi:charged multivesicular body protein 6